MTAIEIPIITRLIPFNPHQFDACMGYLARLYERPLTLFEMVKLHVMTDVYSVLRDGHQVIGGELRPWTYGPVVDDAYNRLKHWAHCHEETQGKFQPEEYEIVPGEACAFRPRADYNPDDISESELDSMERASQLLRPMSFDGAYKFFHGDDTFMGRAYNKAKAEQRSISWSDIIDAHDAIFGSNLQHLKQRLISYG